jgi:hypothetical protein
MIGVPHEALGIGSIPKADIPSKIIHRSKRESKKNLLFLESCQWLDSRAVDDPVFIVDLSLACITEAGEKQDTFLCNELLWI